MYSFSKYLIQCLLHIEDTQIKKLLFEVDLQVKSLQKRAPALPLSSACVPSQWGVRPALPLGHQIPFPHFL